MQILTVSLGLWPPTMPWQRHSGIVQITLITLIITQREWVFPNLEIWKSWGKNCFYFHAACLQLWEFKNIPNLAICPPTPIWILEQRSLSPLQSSLLCVPLGITSNLYQLCVFMHGRSQFWCTASAISSFIRLCPFSPRCVFASIDGHASVNVKLMRW